MTGDRPAWADTPTDEYTLPQRIRDDQAPAPPPRPELAWLAQPTGFFRAVISGLRDDPPQ